MRMTRPLAGLAAVAALTLLWAAWPGRCSAHVVLAVGSGGAGKQPGGQLAGTGRGLPHARRGVRPGPLWSRRDELEPVGVVDRRQAGDRGPGRDIEVLLRPLQHLLQLPPRFVHDPQRPGRGQQPGPGLRVHNRRHPGDAAELDPQHRPERRVRHPGPRLPGDAAVQRVLAEPASERRDHALLQRRHGPALDHRQRRPAARAVAERLEPAVRARRGQAVGGGQRHSRQPLPGPRVRGLGRLQRLGHQGPDGDLPRPRARASTGPSRSAPRPRSGRASRTSTRPSTPPGPCTSRSSRSRRAARRPRSTSHGPPTTVAPGAGSWQRCRTSASCRRPPCRIPPSGTGSWRTSPRAGRTPATST